MRGKVEERNGTWYAIQTNQNQNFNPIATIFNELGNLTLKQAEFKAHIRYINEYYPENLDSQDEICELNIKINELEKLKNNLITQLKLSFNT